MNEARFRRMMARHQLCFELMIAATVMATAGGIGAVFALIAAWSATGALLAVAAGFCTGMAVWMNRRWRFWSRQLQSELRISASTLMAHL